jgi:hypothetical protein
MSWNIAWVAKCALVAGVAGCGMESDHSLGADEIGRTEAATTASYNYNCRCVPGSTPRRSGCYSDWETMAVRLTPKRGTVSMAIWPNPITLVYDSAYRGRGSNADYARYAAGGRGNQIALLVEKPLRTGGYTLRTGGKGGYAKITVSSNDGFDSQKFICRRR